MKLSLVIVAALAVPARATPDPCLRCDIIYASDCGTGLWALDTAAGTSTFIGTMPTNMFDLAMTWDGRLIGLDGGGFVWAISGCDGSGTPIGWSMPGTNALAGDLNSLGLYAGGPPLWYLDGTLTLAPVQVGGGIGAGPPGWCGSTNGHLPMDPADGLLYATLGCGASGAGFGDPSGRLNPATAER